MKTKKEEVVNEIAVATIQEEHDRMRKRAAEFEKEKDGTNVVMAEAFVRGMRDIGYKNTAYALNEVIDNAIEARASKVLVELLSDKGGIKSIAIADNGMGMPKEWIRHCIRWGASHRDRENLRGLGRFGYGLKSSAISFARRVEVYSRIPGEKEWSFIYLDVDDLASGNYRNESGAVGVPPARAATLPDWVVGRLDERGGVPEHGTIVVISKIDPDRIRTRANMAGGTDPEKLKSFFMEQFGVTFRNFLSHTPVTVDGKKVDPIDPLFITPGARFYDIDKDRAEALPPLIIPVKGKDGIQGTIRCRFSVMPPTFLRKPEHKTKMAVGTDSEGKGSKGKLNERFAIRRDNNGFIVLRAGRQIDVVVPKEKTGGTFQNNDRYCGLELDFDPALDAEFAVPTSKQQVVPSMRIWDIMEENGVFDCLKQMRDRYKADAKRIEELSKKQSPDQKAPDDIVPTPAEAAAQSAEKFAPPATKTETLEQATRAEETFRETVEEEAKVRRVPVEKVREEKEQEAKARPYKVVLEDKGAQAPFFRAYQNGGQRVIAINRDHRFYSDVYAHTDSWIRSGIEVLLISIGYHMIRSSGDRHTFYETELIHWSTYLNAALTDLEQYDASSAVSPNAEEEEEVTAKAKKVA